MVRIILTETKVGYFDKGGAYHGLTNTYSYDDIYFDRKLDLRKKDEDIVEFFESFRKACRKYSKGKVKILRKKGVRL